MILITMLIGLFGGNFLKFLELDPSRFFQGEVYRISTYFIVGHSLLDCLFNGLIIWFIGGELERSLGRKGYHILLSISIFSCAIMYLCLSSFKNTTLQPPLNSLTASIQTMIIVYGILHGERIFSLFLIFPIKAKYFCLITIIMVMYNGLHSSSSIVAWSSFASMCTGTLYLYLFYPKASSVIKSYFPKKIKLSNKKSRLTIVRDGNKDKDPKYFQ